MGVVGIRVRLPRLRRLRLSFSDGKTDGMTRGFGSAFFFGWQVAWNLFRHLFTLLAHAKGS